MQTEVSPFESVRTPNAAIRCSHAAQVDPTLLRAHPLNPNTHPAKQLEMFITILNYQGWRRPITVSKLSGCITKGHGAHEAALSAGYTIVPVDYQDYEDESQELADIVADNQLQRMSQMDTGKLSQLLVELNTGSFNLELTGLESVKIESMLSAIPGYRQSTEADLSVDYEEPANVASAQHARETTPSGGPALNEPYHDGVPLDPNHAPQSHVRMIQLFFNEQTVSEFMTIVEFFQRKYEVDNVTDAVLTVLRNSHAIENQSLN